MIGGMSTEIGTHDLYRAHWRHVRRLLPRYGIFGADADDVAQEVWLTVERRLPTYDAGQHKSQIAWITGIVRRCAANHRRATHDGETSMEEPVAAPGLWPSRRQILYDLIRWLPSDEQREALLLQVLEGFSVAEIAAVQNAPVKTVEWRLRMAKERLKGQPWTARTRAGAYLGFGSLEALAEALRPKPIPDEVGSATGNVSPRRSASSGRPPTAPPTMLRCRLRRRPSLRRRGFHPRRMPRCRA